MDNTKSYGRSNLFICKEVVPGLLVASKVGNKAFKGTNSLKELIAVFG